MQKSAIYLTLLLLLASCGGAKSYRSAEGCVWNTTYHITYRADRDLRDSVIAVFRQVERSLSPFAEGSLISRINAGEDVAADSLIRRVFIASREVNRRSHGMFDPTVAPSSTSGDSATGRPGSSLLRRPLTPCWRWSGSTAAAWMPPHAS